MDGLPPGPVDALINVIKWLGVPALALLPFQLFLLIREWLHAASYAGTMVDRFGRAAADDVTNNRLACAIVCLFCQALASASAYAAAQFYVLTISSEHGGFLHVSWSNMLTPMLTYSDPHVIPRTVGLLTIGWLVTLDIASAKIDETAYEILGMVRLPYILIGAATALLGLILIVGFSGLMGFVNGTPWVGIPQFVTGSVIGVLLAVSGQASFVAARPAFGPPK